MSLNSLPGSQARCPISALDHTGLALIKAGYSQVATAFEGFSPPLDEHGHLQRGVYEVVGKKTRVSGVPQSETYHLKSSFTAEQSRYVGASIAALNMLAQGRVLHKKHPTTTTLVSKIITQFHSQEISQASFNQASHDALVSLYDEFGLFYSNLMPAFSAMNQVGGTDGMQTAFLETCDNFLARAMQGSTEASLLSPIQSKIFSSAYPVEGSPKGYEVECSGKAVGKTVIRAAGRAATALAQDRSVADLYLPYNDSPVDPFVKFDLPAELRASVVVATARAALQASV